MKASLLYLIVLFFAFLGPVFPVSAEDNPYQQAPGVAENGQDESELGRLLSVLDKYTEIATKSKLNADYLPGMVTVLSGDNLMARGIKTVAEALRLVPGIEVILVSYGEPAVSVRGLLVGYCAGSNKLMINGVPVNSALSGTNSAFFDIPITQVSQIEVIRGPGSALHGGYANTGLINIITRSEGNSVYGQLGSYTTYGAGGIASWSTPDKDMHLSLNLAGWETDGADTWSGPDILYSIGQGNVSNAPGPANEERSARSAFVNLEYKDFSFVAEYLKTAYGDHFGVNNALPSNSGGTALRSEFWTFELDQHINIRPSLAGNIKLGYMFSEQSTADRVQVFPPGFANQAYIYPYGMDSAFYYNDQRINGAINLIWDGLDRHKIYAEWSISQTLEGDNTWRAANFDINDTGAPTPDNSMQQIEGGIIGEDRERLINSLVLQDEYAATDTFDITAGIRFDSYSDTDDSLTPRLAGVWRITSAHIIKAQYAQAYMPPSFNQLYHRAGAFSLGNDQLKPQTSENFEVGYIYRGAGNVGRITLFYSSLEDMIAIEDGTWANSGGARLTGVEIEFEQQLFSALKLDGNISYSNTEDKDTGAAIAGTANWWANAGLFYEPYRNLTLNAQYRYVGEQNRAPQDTRSDVNASHTIDVTCSLFHLFSKGLTFRAGVKNILDEDVRYAAPANTYPEDYPQPGRRWWLQISYDF